MNPVIAEALNWTTMGTSLALAFIAFMQAYQSWRDKKANAVQEKIHKLVNSKLSAELLIAMVAAKALAVAQPTSLNVEMAHVAEQKYLNQKIAENEAGERSD